MAFSAEDVASGRSGYGSAVPFGEEVGGASVYVRDDSVAMYHTYSTYGRGGEPLILPYFILDRVPRGRDEEGLPWPTAWLRHEDRSAIADEI